MAFKLSPELWVAGFIKSATNGRVISVRFRRILSLIVLPFWILALVIFSLISYTLIINIKENINANHYIKEKISGRESSGDMSMQEYDPYNHMAESFREVETTTSNIKELTWELICIVLILIAPWVLLRLTFWIIDADENSIKKK